MTDSSFRGFFTASIALLLTALSCTTPAARGNARGPGDVPSMAADVTDKSALCDALAGRFLGLPQDTRDLPVGAAPPLAGRFWIRSCAAKRDGANVRLSLSGSGWYWLDHRQSGFRIRQPVALSADAVLSGEFEMHCEEGVAAVHFRPTRDPQLRVEVTERVKATPQNVLTALVRPFAGVSSKAKHKIGSEIESRFLGKLRKGATFTLDLRSEETSMTFGRALPGDRFESLFQDTDDWLANERLLVFPGGVHVLGPFEPDTDMPLEIVVEKGAGLSYHAACATDLERSFRAQPHVPRLSPGIARISGKVQGRGYHRRSVSLRDCRWYLVARSTGRDPSVASVRLGPGMAAE